MKTKFVDEFEFEFSSYEEVMVNPMIGNRRLQLIMQKEQEHTIELRDQRLNDLIRSEPPRNQYINLVMEEHANEFMNEVILEKDDYEDQLKWATHKKKQKMRQFEGSRDVEMPTLFQLGDVNNEQQGIKSDPKNVDERRWEKIKILIKVDLNLHQNKATKQ